MTALAQERMTDFAGENPSRGTFPIKANVRIFKGAMVALDSAGRAMPAGLISAGALAAVGKASATYDNRTGSVLGGAADACNVEVEFGVFGWVTATGGGDDIAADDVGKVCYMKDDQTVALTNGTDTRGLAGFVTEVRDGYVYVYQGPHVAGLIVIAADEAAQLDTAQTDIDTAQADILALQVDAATANASFNVPLTSFVLAAGTPLAAYSAGNTGVPGFNLINSEAICIDWNNYPSNAGVTIWTQCALPSDLDDTAAVVVQCLTSKTGATAGDTGTLTFTGYILSVGDLNNADTAFTADMAGMTATATAGTTAEQTYTISAADVPSGARTLTFSLTPKSGTLETDDILLHSVRIKYTRKIQTS